MPIPTESRTLNTLFATTSYAMQDESTENMLQSFPLVNLLYKNGRATKKDGGARIAIPIRYGINPGAQWFQGADTLDMTPFETTTTAFFDWKNLHAPITYTGEEERKNRGQYQMIDLVAEKMSTTETTLSKILDIAMCGDGTGNDGKVILGLDALFPVSALTDPTIGAVGGITAVGNPWWQSSSTASFGSFAANGPKGTASDAFITIYNSLSDGADRPDFIISAQNVFEFYNRSVLSTAQTYMNTGGTTGSLSFPSLAYQGIPWVWDRNIVSGRVFMLRSGDLGFYVHPEANMQLAPGGFRKSWNQDLYGSSMLLMCVMFAKRRLFGGVIDGITA